MEEVPSSSQEACSFDGDLPLDECLDQRTSSNLSAVSGHALVVSYAHPDVVRQAKLEAMGIKIRRKMLERKASMLDPHALRDFPAASTSSLRVCARASAVGSRELVKSLVVPPALTEHGEEVRGSSEVILAGERIEYQRPGRVQASAQSAGPMPSYRMYDPSKQADAADIPKKKAWGAEAPATASPGSRRGGGAVAGKAKQPERSELATQLSDGMLAYVPSKFQRPKDVESTAFVPQAQAMMAARNQVHSGKQRRPSSAPLRRSTSVARSVDSEGFRSGATAADDDVGPTGAGDAAAGAATSRDNKRMNITVVRVEETDLLALYRQSSLAAVAAAGGEPHDGQQARRSSSIAVRGTASSRSLASVGSRAHDGPPGVARATAAAAATNGGGKPGSAASPYAVPKGRKQSVTVIEPHEEHAAAQRRLNSGGSKAAWTPRNAPLSSSAGFGSSPPNAAAGCKPPGPASTAAYGLWSGAPSSAAASARVWSGPRPPSPIRAVGPSRSVRRTSAPAGGGVSSGAAPAPAKSSVSVGGRGPRVGFQPVDPETRRLRQHQSGPPIGTAKTNRLRGSVRSSGGSLFTAEGHPAWATSSTSFTGLGERSLLQARILNGLVRQYTIGADDEVASESSEGGNAAGKLAYRRPGRPQAVDMPAAAALAAAALAAAQRGALGTAEHQPPQVARPQSAPNRRVRPPSAGSWAGRPDPDSLVARPGNGVVYDPELQPSPLDSYMNQLVGLD